MSGATSPLRPLIAGNWKMNGLAAALAEARCVRDALTAETPEVLLCPPATLLREMARMAEGSRLETGGQDCHPAAAGAHTGDVSAAMLADAGAAWVILGHSERRSGHGETDALVAAKMAAALAAGLSVILCLGETAGERRAGLTLGVTRRQLTRSLAPGAAPDRIAIAYEPVWAIGTGLTPSPEDVAGVLGDIRGNLLARFGTAGEGVRLLYGGSVTPGNAATLARIINVNGVLVGGASLKAHDFLGIIAAWQQRVQT